MSVPTDALLPLRGTLKDLAAELGLTHEALYRALAGLASKGEIKRLKNKIVLEKLVAYVILII